MPRRRAALMQCWAVICCWWESHLLSPATDPILRVVSGSPEITSRGCTLTEDPAFSQEDCQGRAGSRGRVHGRALARKAGVK